MPIPNPETLLTCAQVPWERKYLAGWGYVLSRDVAKYIAATVLRYERFPSLAPGWWRGLHWEDVMVGLLAGDYIGEQPTVRARVIVGFVIRVALRECHGRPAGW